MITSVSPLFFYRGRRESGWEQRNSDVVHDLLKVTQKPENRELLGKVFNYWTSAGLYFDVAAKVDVSLHLWALNDLRP